MRFYRPLGQIFALTFDLDNTLYDNSSVILRSEKKLLMFIQNYHHLLKTFRDKDFQKLHKELRKNEPEIYHDVTEWRRRTVELAMLHAGLNPKEAAIGAATAMTYFIKWRSCINVSQETHDILSILSKKKQLAVITNGNAQPEMFGLGDYFQFVLYAGKHGRSKPFIDMYCLAAEKFGLLPNEILHVGDDLITDIAGAISCGMQACWIRKKNINSIQIPNRNLLPHVEISHLSSLTLLI